MDAFSPEFAKYWQAGQGESASEAAATVRGDDGASVAQREAFEALAERVSAARSVL